MTQTPFRGGDFNPVRAADYTPALQYKLDLINRGFDMSDSQRIQNEQANVKNA